MYDMPRGCYTVKNKKVLNINIKLNILNRGSDNGKHSIKKVR